MKRILFVDDEPHLLEAIQRMFRAQRKTWQMSFAKNGNEALTLLAADEFDVVVTDMRMPEMDGATLLERMRESHPSVVRIVLSGHVEMEAAVRGAAVAHQFLSKPCEAEKLRAAIQRACDCRANLCNEDIRRVVGAVGQLPSLPGTCALLLDAVQEPDVNMSRVGGIIEQDVGMAAKILQLVNSAFFGLRSEMTDVHAAVTYLGLDTVKQLVLSVELFRTFRPSPMFASWLSEFEAHCRLAARIARRLPTPSGLGSTAIVASLLHDIGKLVIATRLPSQFELALRTAIHERIPFHIVEEGLIGTNHAEVGGYLLGLWGFPDAIVEAARQHHRPKTPLKHCDACSVIALTHVADALARESREDPAGQASSIFNLLDMNYIGELGMSDQLPSWRALARQAVGVVR